VRLAHGLHLVVLPTDGRLQAEESGTSFVGDARAQGDDRVVLARLSLPLDEHVLERGELGHHQRRHARCNEPVG